MGIRVRLCSDWCLREADILSDYPQTSVSCIVRTQYPYFAQRYAGITGFGPVVLYALKFLTQPLQKHQQEADQQHRTGSPDCGDSKVQGHDTSYTGSNGKEENNAKIIEKLPQLLRLVLAGVDGKCVCAASQVADAHRARIGETADFSKRLYLHRTG